MPTTAFSTHFQGEYDVVQLLRKAGHQIDEDPGVGVISDQFRQWIAADVKCSGCNAYGATVVSAAKSRSQGGKRAQAHFRFGSPGRPDAHDILCEFYGDKENTDRSKNLVDFNKANSDLTRHVRQLICNGLEIGAFSQQTMRDMRMWFLAKRKEHSFELNIDEEFIRQCSLLPRVFANALRSPPFRVSMAKLPEFNWSAVTYRVFRDRNLSLFEASNRPGDWIGERDVDRVIRLCQKWNGQLVFDPNLLGPEYSQAIDLAQFVADYQRSRKTVTIAKYIAPSAEVNAFLAFSALLLFANAWDSGAAMDAFVRIRTAPPALPDLAGNLIGLNPFHDYATWNSLMLATRLKSIRPGGLNVAEELQLIENELKLEAGLRS